MAPINQTYYLPTSGTDGELFIGGYSYPAWRWEYAFSTSAIPIPTPASSPYEDMIPANKRCTFSASGCLRWDFNPFSLSHLYLGTYQIVIMKPNGITSATMPNALITKWRFEQEVAGLCTWNLECIGSWKFEDLSAQNA